MVDRIHLGEYRMNHKNRFFSVTTTLAVITILLILSVVPPTATSLAAGGCDPNEMTDVGTPRCETLIVQTFDGKVDTPSNFNPLSGSYGRIIQKWPDRRAAHSGPGSRIQKTFRLGSRQSRKSDGQSGDTYGCG